MKVLAWPAFRPTGNPYNQLLYRAICRKGGQVSECSIPRLLAGRFDILHLHWPEWLISHESFASSIARFARFVGILTVARRKGMRVVWTVHNVLPHENYHPWLTSRFYATFIPHVDGFISLNRANVDAIIAHHPLLRDRPHAVTPHGDYRSTYENRISRGEARRALGLPEHSRVALYFGVIRPYKNVPRLVRSFREIDDPHHVLVVAGTPSTRALAEDIRAAAGNDPRVRLRFEFVPAHEVQLYFNAADMVVLPFADSWNSGTAILALSFNRPVVLPEIDFVLELRELVGGEWIRPYRNEMAPNVLREAFSWLAHTSRPQVACLDKLSWDAIAESTLEFYRRVIGTTD